MNLVLREDELIVDNFAGGGGASLGIEWALGRSPDVAINHDPIAIAMHRANHPRTRHFVQNICAVDPVEVVQGRPVGVAWFSPDCTHHSKASGRRPRSKRVRDLAWVVAHWAYRVRPRLIFFENVEEIQSWGPLCSLVRDHARCPECSGEHAPALVDRPCPTCRGIYWEQLLRRLRSLGYRLECRELRACDYGAPTIRKRLYMIARCDGAPIVWPEPTHGPGRLPYRPASECIDWSIPCPSIFGRPKDLVPATHRRIARGFKRFFIDADRPFFVPEAVSWMVPHYGERAGQAPRCHSTDTPFPTLTPSNNPELVMAWLAQHNTGATGHPLSEPLSTIMGTGTHQQLVTAFMTVLRNNMAGRSLEHPTPTILTNNHLYLVAAWLNTYYRTDQASSLNDPLPTVTTKARFGLTTFLLWDIGMRMFTSRELFRGNGFPDSYILDPIHKGRPLSKTAQLQCCGNSVCPDVARALVAANYTDHSVTPRPLRRRIREPRGQGALL